MVSHVVQTLPMRRSRQDLKGVWHRRWNDSRKLWHLGYIGAGTHYFFFSFLLVLVFGSESS